MSILSRSTTRKLSSSDDNRIIRQSFLRRCTINQSDIIYYVCVQSKQTYLLNYQDQMLSFYQLSILSPLTICNLLPCPLTFQMLPHLQTFELDGCKSHREHTWNILQSRDIRFATKLYHMNKPLCLPSINDLNGMKYKHQRVIFYDCVERELMVDITILCAIKHCLKVLISVPFAFLNKTGKICYDF